MGSLEKPSSKGKVNFDPSVDLRSSLSTQNGFANSSGDNQHGQQLQHLKQQQRHLSVQQQQLEEVPSRSRSYDVSDRSSQAKYREFSIASMTSEAESIPPALLAGV